MSQQHKLPRHTGTEHQTPTRLAKWLTGTVRNDPALPDQRKDVHPSAKDKLRKRTRSSIPTTDEEATTKIPRTILRTPTDEQPSGSQGPFLTDPYKKFNTSPKHSAAKKNSPRKKQNALVYRLCVAHRTPVTNVGQLKMRVFGQGFPTAPDPTSEQAAVIFSRCHQKQICAGVPCGG